MNRFHVNVFHHDLETIENFASDTVLVLQNFQSFHFTIPSEAAKNAKICLMKYFHHHLICCSTV